MSCRGLVGAAGRASREHVSALTVSFRYTLVPQPGWRQSHSWLSPPPQLSSLSQVRPRSGSSTSTEETGSPQPVLLHATSSVLRFHFLSPTYLHSPPWRTCRWPSHGPPPFHRISLFPSAAGRWGGLDQGREDGGDARTRPSPPSSLQTSPLFRSFPGRLSKHRKYFSYFSNLQKCLGFLVFLTRFSSRRASKQLLTFEETPPNVQTSGWKKAPTPT